MFLRRGGEKFVKSFFFSFRPRGDFSSVTKSDMMKIKGRSPSATTAFRWQLCSIEFSHRLESGNDVSFSRVRVIRRRWINNILIKSDIGDAKFNVAVRNQFLRQNFAPNRWPCRSDNWLGTPLIFYADVWRLSKASSLIEVARFMTNTWFVARKSCQLFPHSTSRRQAARCLIRCNYVHGVTWLVNYVYPSRHRSCMTHRWVVWLMQRCVQTTCWESPQPSGARHFLEGNSSGKKNSEGSW